MLGGYHTSYKITTDKCWNTIQKNCFCWRIMLAMDQMICLLTIWHTLTTFGISWSRVHFTLRMFLVDTYTFHNPAIKYLSKVQIRNGRKKTADFVCIFLKLSFFWKFITTYMKVFSTTTGNFLFNGYINVIEFR